MSQPSNQTPPLSDQPPGAPPARKRRGLRLALVASLMVNLLLIGMLAGGMMRYARLAAPDRAEPDLRSLWRALPGEERRALHAMMRERGLDGDHRHRPGLAATGPEARRAQARSTNRAIVDLLRAEPFDRAAFAAILAQDSESRARRLSATQAAFAERVAALDPAQRLQMAERLQRGSQRPARD